MNDSKTKGEMQAGFELLSNYARIIAMLPLEDWIAAFDRAETIAPFVDPTLYREYAFSGRGEVIKKVIRAALPLKKAILEIQPEVAKIMQSEAKVRS